MDEYWEDYGEFNEQIETLRDSLKSTVKTEVAKELQTLREQNKSLKNRLSNLDALEKEADARKRQADNEYENATRKANYAKADELFKYLEEAKYTLSRKSHTLPKCDNCDEKRHVPFTYPSGKESYEVCVTCGNAKYQWEVSPAVGTSIDIRNQELMVWYKPFSYKDDDDYHSMSGSIMKLYSDEGFEAVEKYRRDVLFNDEETAQKYADYLNQKDVK